MDIVLCHRTGHFSISFSLSGPQIIFFYLNSWRGIQSTPSVKCSSAQLSVPFWQSHECLNFSSREADPMRIKWGSYLLDLAWISRRNWPLCAGSETQKLWLPYVASILLTSVCSKINCSWHNFKAKSWRILEQGRWNSIVKNATGCYRGAFWEWWS